ncbi:DUF3164 family protein [Sinomicrobium kalidii]|uniref:DUF3164 family protein n=1 Tax=Sinomicrobium kalidii TaxID=2900738 RepID=UPI001E4EF8FB|nr:DUF3164 family protein [Sinomicrobium kalidii]UGU15186.1 DUF3164 family protein [Sinomicrobium kalidii]
MIDLSTLSADELQAELMRREKAKKKAKEKARQQYLEDKNYFLRTTAQQFLQYNEGLHKLKEHTIAEANMLYERMYVLEGKKPKETKSFPLKNEDDTIKIEVEQQERFEFTEEAIVHINTIKDIFKEKFAARSKGLYNILDGLLIKGRQREYDPKLLAKARRQVKELGDEKLIAEFDKLDDCQRVVGTVIYCRLYIKGDNGKWQNVSLQFSAL